MTISLPTLQALMEKATPGEWQAYCDSLSHWVVTEPRNENGAVALLYNGNPMGQEEYDAALIIAMHAALPHLMAVARAAQEVVGSSQDHDLVRSQVVPQIAWDKLSAALLPFAVGEGK